MSVKVNCETSKGGAVEFDKKNHVWSSYAVAGVADIPPAELFYAGLKLDNGRTISLFVNRETGLIVVDVLHKNGKQGNEILRVDANQVKV